MDLIRLDKILKNEKMKNKFFILFVVTVIFFILLPNTITAQANSELINPKGKWFFGLEIGSNKINSLSLGEPKKSLQAGLLAEYYFARHWSLSGRIKYFETGVSFYKPNTHSGSWFDLGSDASFGVFNGAVVTTPLNIKWEFRIYKNLGASLKMGGAYTLETKSNYSDYSNNLSTDYSKQYTSFNAGYGFNYFVNKKTAVYLDVEAYLGESKGHSEGFFGNIHYNTENILVNFGVKHNFKK